MTAVESASGGGSVTPGEAVATAVPSETTLPSRPAKRSAPQRRPLTVVRQADVLAVIGALVAAVASSALLWQEISPFSGIIGYFVVTWFLFVLYYAMLISFDENRATVRDRLASVVMQSLALLVLAALGWVIAFTISRGWPALVHVNFYTQDGTNGGPLNPLTQGGALHAIVGTLIMIGIAMGIAMPLGILTAIFMNEVPGPFSRFIRTVVDAMTAMPDILAGLFIFATVILSFGLQYCGLAAGLALAITALPIVARASDVVLRLMPGGLTEASYALGAGQWRTVRHVTLPTVRSGLATAVILGAARAIGETAPPLLTAGATDYLNFNPVHEPMAALPVFAFLQVQEPSKFSQARAFGAATLLLVLVVALFVTARKIGGRGPGVLTARQRRRRAAASRRDLARFNRRAEKMSTQGVWR
jgi:phosphate transport system permease protein